VSRSGRASEIPKIPSVLATTDLSELANRAIPHAYAVVDDGGTVHLAHVLEIAEPDMTPNPLYAHYTPGRVSSSEELARVRDSVAARLRTLVPPEAETRGVRTEVHVTQGVAVAEAVAELADGVGAAMLCVGSRGRSGIAKLLLGSTAAGILKATRRPVLIVRVDGEP
jgi:nucleotide-binding universal stress UspA family protein